MTAALPEFPRDRLAALRQNLSEAKGFRAAVEKSLADTKAEIKKQENEEELCGLVAGLFQTLIDNEVTEGVQAVEALQTEGLLAVFDDQELRVKAHVDLHRGKVSVNLRTIEVSDGGHEVEGDCLEAYGGSVTTVQSILMRSTVMLRRGLRPVLLLDESLPAFDDNYVGNMARFLAALSDRLGMDILLITHNAVLAEHAQQGYRIRKSGGKATFQAVR